MNNFSRFDPTKDAEQRKNQFKAHAINKRAEKYGKSIQMTIIEAPTEDKQCMFEAAEVMNALLNAVEAGKKNLRIDYTPYRVLDGPKHWKKQAQETIKEVDSRDPDELEEERERKREQVANFMERYEENLDDRLGRRDDLEMEYEEEEKKKQ